MKLFKKYPLLGAAASALRQKVDNTTRNLGLRCAAYLQRKDASLSVKQRKLFFFAFIALGCLACSAILFDTLRGAKPLRALKIPVHSGPVPKPSAVVPRFTSSDTLNLKRFRLVVDSLGATPEGRQRLDSIFDRHPGLLEGFLKAEKQFQLTTK